MMTKLILPIVVILALCSSIKPSEDRIVLRGKYRIILKRWNLNIADKVRECELDISKDGKDIKFVGVKKSDYKFQAFFVEEGE